MVIEDSRIQSCSTETQRNAAGVTAGACNYHEILHAL